MSADVLKNTNKDFSNIDVDVLQIHLDALEDLVRSYTNNHFQDVRIRFSARSESDILFGSSPFLKVGDTIEIGNSVNDGLYVVKEIGEGFIKVDKPLFPTPDNLVTKVEYPKSVIFGVLNLMKWENENRDKVGIQSETISRHSVTYFNQDKNNQTVGYPSSLMGFLTPFRKARF